MFRSVTALVALVALLLSNPEPATANTPHTPISHPLLEAGAGSDETLFPRSMTARSAARERAQAVHQRARAIAPLHARARTRRAWAIDEGQQRAHAALRIASAYERPAERFETLRGNLHPPVTPFRAQHPFGVRRRLTSNTQLPHHGLSWETPPGTPVLAAARGVVVTATFVEGLGGLLIIDHGEGWHTIYAQLIAHAVEVGQVVLPGSLIGEGGNRSTFGLPEVYFELRQDGIALDPAPWLPERVRPRPTS